MVFPREFFKGEEGVALNLCLDVVRCVGGGGERGVPGEGLPP